MLRHISHQPAYKGLFQLRLILPSGHSSILLKIFNTCHCNLGIRPQTISRNMLQFLKRLRNMFPVNLFLPEHERNGNTEHLPDRTLNPLCHSFYHRLGMPEILCFHRLQSPHNHMLVHPCGFTFYGIGNFLLHGQVNSKSRLFRKLLCAASRQQHNRET